MRPVSTPTPCTRQLPPPRTDALHSNEASEAQLIMEEDDVLYADATMSDDAARQKTGATPTS